MTSDLYRTSVVGDLVFVQVEKPLLEHVPSGNRAAVSLISEFEIRDGLIAQLTTYPESGAIERMAFGKPSQP